MGTYRERDLLRKGMTMHNSGITSTNDVLVVQNSQLSLKRGHCVDRLLRAGYHVSGSNVFIIYSANTNTDVVTANGRLDFVFHLVVEGGNFDVVLVGHENESVTLA